MKAEKYGTTGYSIAELCASAVRGIICTILMLQSVCYLCKEFSGWEIPVQMNFRMQVLLLVIVVMYEFAPLCGKYRALAGILLEIISFLGAGLFFYENYEKMCLGQEALYSDYIQYWNRYYGTNYIGYESDKYLLFFLSSLIFAFFLVFIIFRYITGVRVFLLIPGIAALIPGLLVNVCPDWMSLCLFFTGALMVYSGPGKKSKVVFCIRDNKKSRFKQKATLFAVPFVVLILSIGILFLSSALFSEAAADIPEKNPEFMKIQKSLENKIKSLEKSGISFSSDWAHVDNHTPEYSGEKVLSIYSSIQPESNLYLKDFYSGTYEGGKWVEESKVFEEAAENADIDADFGMLLHQMYLKALKNSGYKLEMADYRIDYDTSFSRDAFVPYFTDLQETGKDVWVEDEGLVKKSRGVKSLAVSGLTKNTGNYLDAFEKEDNRELEWYTDYVSTHYGKGVEGVPVLDEFVKEMEEQFGTVVYLYSGSNSDIGNSAGDIYQMNMQRMMYADQVRSLLDEKADYNLYLDEIPDQTDTIQYFLETGHEGYCMHFASAGALLLQKLGIPARYASGYVVEAAAFQKEGEGYSASVQDRNAHAWTEIYLEGIGWIPFEMTPGYLPASGSGLPTDEDRQDELKKQHEEKKQQENQDNSVQESEKEELETEKNTESEPEESESKTEQNGTDNDKNNNRKWSDRENTTKKYVLICLFTSLAFLVFLAGGFYAFSRRYSYILAQDLKNERNRRAVKRINHQIYKTLWTARTLTDEEYLEKLIQKYPAISKDEWKNYMKIIQKAAFSKEEITREEAAFCYKCYRIRKKK